MNNVLNVYRVVANLENTCFIQGKSDSFNIYIVLFSSLSLPVLCLWRCNSGMFLYYCYSRYVVVVSLIVYQYRFEFFVFIAADVIIVLSCFFFIVVIFCRRFFITIYGC